MTKLHLPPPPRKDQPTSYPFRAQLAALAIAWAVVLGLAWWVYGGG